jgi:TrmH family RNA methyltransferase
MASFRYASASALDEGLAYSEVSWSDGFALILGPEAQGLTPKEIARADATVFIPMGGPVESLNVAVAAGVVLYEAKRQRST